MRKVATVNKNVIYCLKTEPGNLVQKESQLRPELLPVSFLPKGTLLKEKKKAKKPLMFLNFGVGVVTTRVAVRNWKN